jgi:hypothetical protein
MSESPVLANSACLNSCCNTLWMVGGFGPVRWLGIAVLRRLRASQTVFQISIRHHEMKCYFARPNISYFRIYISSHRFIIFTSESNKHNFRDDMSDDIRTIRPVILQYILLPTLACVTVTQYKHIY